MTTWNLSCDDCWKKDGYRYQEHTFPTGTPEDEVEEYRGVCQYCGGETQRTYMGSNIMITGDLPTITHYYDPTLGEVSGLRDKKDKMKAMGLIEHEPDEALHKEIKHIRQNVSPKKQPKAVNEFAAKHVKVKRDKQIDKKLDQVMRTL